MKRLHALLAALMMITLCPALLLAQNQVSSSSGTSYTPNNVDLSFTIDDYLTTTMPGLPHTYTVTVHNNGPNEELSGRVHASFPNALTNLSWTSVATGGASGSAGSGNADIDEYLDIPAGATVIYTVSGIIDPSESGTLEADGYVFASEIEQNPADNSDSDQTTLEPTADISVTKTDGQSTTSGDDPITYTIVVSNAGPSQALGVLVNDIFPADFTSVNFTTSITGTVYEADASGSGAILDTLIMAPGSSVTYTAVGQLDPSASGTISNTAMVSPLAILELPDESRPPTKGVRAVSKTAARVFFNDPDESNNSATDNTLIEAGPYISLDDVSQDEIASPFNFTVSLDEAAGSDVTIQYTTFSGSATAGADFDSVSSSVTIGTGQTSATLPVTVLDDNWVEGSENFTVKLTAAAGASITDSTGLGTIIDNDASEIRIRLPDGELVDSGDSDLMPNDEAGTRGISYMVHNTGNGILEIPAGGVTGGNYVRCSGLAVTTALPLNIAPGDSAALDISIFLDGGDYSFDLSIVNNDSDENPFVLSVEGFAAVIRFSKEFIPSQALAGDTVALKFTLQNIHPSKTATDINFTDELYKALTGLQSISPRQHGVVGPNSDALGDSIFGLINGELPAATTNSFQISVKVPASAVPGSYVNTTAGLLSKVDGVQVYHAGGATDTLEVLPSQAEMEIHGNFTLIPNGDTTPSFTDSTDFGKVKTGLDSTVRVFLLGNLGSDILYLPDMPSISITGPGAADFSMVSAIPAPSIAPDTTWEKLYIQFTPTVTGLRQAVISIANTDADRNPYTFTVQGTGIAPEIDIQKHDGTSIPCDSTYNLGRVAINQDTLLQFIVSNLAGSDSLHVATPILSNEANINVKKILPWGVSLPAADSTMGSIDFSIPRAEYFHLTVLYYNTDADENAYTFSLEGYGYEPTPEIDMQRLNGTSIPHGGTDSTGSWQPGVQVFDYIVDNSAGTCDLAVIAQTAANLSNCTLLGSVTPLPLTVARGSSDTLSFGLELTNRGPFSFDWTIENTDTSEHFYTISVQGQCIAPEIAMSWPGDTSLVDVDTLDWGERPPAADTLSLYIENAGDDTLRVTGLTSANLSNISAVSAAGTFPLLMAPAAKETLDVAVTIAGLGIFSADLDIASNDGDENPFDLHLRGTGVLPEIEIRDGNNPLTSGMTTYFGDQGTSQGSYKPVIKNWQVHNIGTGALLISGPATLSGPDADQFHIVQSPGDTSLAAGDSSALEVHFRPTSVGDKTAVLQLVNNDGDENPYVINLRGTGTDLCLTLLARPIGAGHVQPYEGTRLYARASVIPIQAQPAPGYRFVRWKGYNIADTRSPITTTTVDWHSHAVAFFEPVNGTARPSLSYAYPVDSALFVPTNSPVQFRMADAGKGVDLQSLNTWINNTPIVYKGTDMTGGCVEIRREASEYCVLYQPAEPFAPDSIVTVRVCFTDTSAAPQGCDSCWTFQSGTVCMDTTTAVFDYLGGLGGVLSNEALDVRMAVPPEALQDTVLISISTLDSLPELPDGLAGIGLNYHFGPEGLQAARPIEVTIPYTQADLDSAGVTVPQDLTVNYYLTATGEWIELPVVAVDETAQHLTVEVDQFCIMTYSAAALNSACEEAALPASFKLYQNYPNPFNPSTTIHYALPAAAEVTLNVYDVTGRLIRCLVSRQQPAGNYLVRWTADNDAGLTVPSGVYIIKLKADDRTMHRKMLFMK